MRVLLVKMGGLLVKMVKMGGFISEKGGFIRKRWKMGVLLVK
jgi:hypothetical protein